MIVIRTHRHKLTQLQVKQAQTLMRKWNQVHDEIFDFGKGSSTEMLVDTLRGIQLISPSDIVIIHSIFMNPDLQYRFQTVDPVLLKTFSEVLNRTVSVYRECLSLPELYHAYVELLPILSKDPILINSRDSFSKSLLCRISSGETIPVSFPVLHFLDTFSGDITHEVLNEVSKWIRKRATKAKKDCQSDRVSEELATVVVSIQSFYEKLGCSPSSDFIETVRILVCS